MGETASITMLGAPCVSTQRGGRVAFSSQRSKNLLFILALERGRALAREKLFDMLWPEAPPARPRRALNNEVWRLRKSFAASGVDVHELIVSDSETLTLKEDSTLDIDLHAFEDAADRAHENGPGAPQHAVQAEQLYRGELLAGVYEDWCLGPREACSARFIDTMERLLEIHLSRGGWREAIRVGKRILEEDRLLEHIHRQIMRCYAHLGDRASAARQFENLRQNLRDELNVSPSPETAALFDALRNDAPEEAAGHAAPVAHGVAEQDLKKQIMILTRALAEAEGALAKLRDAVDLPTR